MQLDESPAIAALRTELRAYFADVMSPATTRALDDSSSSAATIRAVVRRMGKDGWLGIGWPREFGGQGRGPIEQLVFYEEVQRAGAPYPLVTLNTVGPTLMAHGTPEQQAAYLPGILAGEIHFAIGYTEPAAGTDLASLRTRAVRDGDHYVVTGNKVFTSGGDLADFIWLACRTDPDAVRHRGISILIVDTTSSGFSWTPINTVGSQLTTATYYDGVEVPAANLVGEENRGWQLITSQLNHERVALGAGSAAAHAMYDATVEWAAATSGDDGRPVLDQPWVQSELATVYARLSAMHLLNHRMAAAMETGEPGPADSSMVKVLTSESAIAIYQTLLGVLGSTGHLVGDSAGSLIDGRLERLARHAQINTFGGGVNEVQRELIAVSALGLPRGSR
ncbi:MAG TPA: acyl-CoA dehydrogenase family protein [Frankiaceae bacterium]|nr:acyl-CoA dehydrogenase family protein [Frankiaceae bacterium]